jgi:hypothetical protein
MTWSLNNHHGDATSAAHIQHGFAQSLIPLVGWDYIAILDQSADHNYLSLQLVTHPASPTHNPIRNRSSTQNGEQCVEYYHSRRGTGPRSPIKAISPTVLGGGAKFRYEPGPHAHQRTVNWSVALSWLKSFFGQA